MSLRLLPLAVLFLGACSGDKTQPDGETDAADADTDADTDSDTDADTDSDTDADSDADTDTSTSGLVTGSGTAVVTTTWAGTEEISVLELVDDTTTGTVLCQVSYELTSTGLRSDCAQCDFAVDLVIGNASVDTDVNGACLASLGVDAATIASWNGQPKAYGYIAEYFGHAEVYVEYDGAEWNTKGYASLDTVTHELSYSWEGDVLTW
ncbi:MAG: hypothetical protein H6735_33965 [Alphaproteobacteria bacterium]|nr:hypothetical protein [Alphaproteobacteria bacterium]